MTENDQNHHPEEAKSFGTNDRPIPIVPERHGCVTAWLVFILIVNSICTVLYLFESGLMEKRLKVSFITILMIVILGVLNTIFAFMILSWKKAGFYGFFATTIVSFIINFCIKLPLIPTLIGLSGIAILYGILQIKKNGRPAWFYLK